MTDNTGAPDSKMAPPTIQEGREMPDDSPHTSENEGEVATKGSQEQSTVESESTMVDKDINEGLTSTPKQQEETSPPSVTEKPRLEDSESDRAIPKADMETDVRSTEEEAPLVAVESSCVVSGPATDAAEDTDTTTSTRGSDPSVHVVVEGSSSSELDSESPEGEPKEKAVSATDEIVADQSTESDDKPSRRKRKRRRKRQPSTADSASGEVDSAEVEGPRVKKKEFPQAPLGRFFSGVFGAKRHAFAVGEAVAGRVIRCEHGAILIDLFGKATAVADEMEPRTIPATPEPPTESESAAKAEDVQESTVNVESEEIPLEAPLVSTAEESADKPVTEPASGGITEEDVQDKALQDQDAELELPSDSMPLAASEAELSEAGEITGPEVVEIEESVALSSEALNEAQTDTVTTEPENTEVSESNVGATGECAIDESDTDAPAREYIASIPPEVSIEPEPLPEPPVIGQIFKGRVGAIAESGHVALINRNIDVSQVRETIERNRAERRRVQGVVFGYNRGGFDVIIEGIRAFCPASGMSLSEIKDPEQFIGRKCEFSLPVSKGGGKPKDLIVTRRTILEKENRKRIKELLRSLKSGQVLQGKVAQVRDYGLFVDIGGIEGLVHQSELSYAFGVKPQDVAKLGDEIEVKILKVGSDSESKKDRNTRISLSIKALLPDPWDTHTDVIAEGTVQQGIVTRTTEFGAFIELAPSVEGLLHISELGRDLKHANQALKEGEQLHVVVERADRNTRRISLSKLSSSALEEYKSGQLGDTGKRPKGFHQGARVSVKVDSYENRGLVVRVVGAVGKRARGFIPSNELSAERGAELRKSYPQGAELLVKVIGVERDGSLKCSEKALAIDDERRAVKEYRREASKQGFGTFGDLLRAKLNEVNPK